MLPVTYWTGAPTCSKSGCACTFIVRTSAILGSMVEVICGVAGF